MIENPNKRKKHALDLHKQIVEWLYEHLVKNELNGYVLGMSGGIDSSVMALLGSESAARKSRDFLGLILPIFENDIDYYDSEAALVVAEMFDLNVEVIDLTQPYKALKEALPSGQNKPVVYTNIKARLRSTVIYSFSNARDYMVLGTVNKGELAIGYFPKNASAGDILPIADLYKWEIREIGRTYGIPENIVRKKASGCIWADTAEAEWGFTELELDTMLEIFGKRGKEALLSSPAVESAKAKLFLQKNRESEHKRRFYPVLRRGDLET